MDELQELRKKEAEAFDKHLHHQQLTQKHEELSRRWRYEQFRLKHAREDAERELATPIRVVYHD